MPQNWLHVWTIFGLENVNFGARILLNILLTVSNFNWAILSLYSKYLSEETPAFALDAKSTGWVYFNHKTSNGLHSKMVFS